MGVLCFENELKTANDGIAYRTEEGRFYRMFDMCKISSGRWQDSTKILGRCKTNHTEVGQLGIYGRRFDVLALLSQHLNEWLGTPQWSTGRERESTQVCEVLWWGVFAGLDGRKEEVSRLGFAALSRQVEFLHGLDSASKTAGVPCGLPR